MNSIERIKNDFFALPDILAEYADECDKVGDIIQIPVNELKKANREQASWQLYYDEKKSELHALLKYMDMKVATTKSKLYVSYTQTHDRDLTEAGKKVYIEGEPAYLNMYQLMLEVKEMYEKYLAISSAFQSRGYAINNLTKLAIATVEDVTY